MSEANKKRSFLAFYVMIEKLGSSNDKGWNVVHSCDVSDIHHTNYNIPFYLRPYCAVKISSR